LLLAAALAQSETRLAGAFNFGPSLAANRSVETLVKELLKHWPGDWQDRWESDAPHESRLLNLATDKAFHLLGWRSVWSFEEAARHTMYWYREVCNADRDEAETARKVTRAQLQEYRCAAARHELSWAR
jgi:CDP-glucose 4,6-dehydratase